MSKQNYVALTIGITLIVLGSLLFYHNTVYKDLELSKNTLQEKYSTLKENYKLVLDTYLEVFDAGAKVTIEKQNLRRELYLSLIHI